MSQFPAAAAPAVEASAATGGAVSARLRRAAAIPLYLAAILLASTVLVVAAEAVLRGSLAEAAAFLVDPGRPGWATVALLALALIGIDAFTRRGGQALLLAAPPLLALAWVGSEKRFYLGDPPYPTDFLYARQIAELMPLMLVERPMAAALIVLGLLAGAALLVIGWRWSRRLPKTGLAGRAARLAVAVPALGYFASQMDYASHSDLRQQLGIAPKMWDQTANYRHNGLVMAFALNVPMATIAPPAGYSQGAMAAIAAPAAAPFVPASRPDIVMVMSESFWDPTRLPGVTLSPDPLAFTRTVQSGHVFSPEFGGMTSNVEFEALTGFSNALLPYGSIPYQQYIRGEMPSLASFLAQEGYATLAIHPFQSWFWNRGPVYEAFGFDRFLSEGKMPAVEKRGRLASDEALTELLIAEVDASEEPIFAFAVTLQNHGPYEPDRYPDSRIEVATDAGEPARAAVRTFAEGMMDSDRALKRLIEWARTRERETVVVLFGDHLPPLGPTWVATGFMERNVSNRFGPVEKLTEERETPLVIWSSRKGVVAGAGTVSPAFLPLHILRAAGAEHPFYTGFLGELHERWRVVDRHVLIDRAGDASEGWARRPRLDPLLRDYRLIQHDAMFGSGYGAGRFFPDAPAGRHWAAAPATQHQR